MGSAEPPCILLSYQSSSDLARGGVQSINGVECAAPVSAGLTLHEVSDTLFRLGSSHCMEVGNGWYLRYHCRPWQCGSQTT